MMSQKTEITQLLRRAHLFITEGQEKEALATLDKIQTDNPDYLREIAYLRAWCCTFHTSWDEAAGYLAPYYSQVSADNLQDMGQTERRRRAFYLLMLGNAAADLSRFEEATHHYTHCLKLLDERRMNVKSVRIKARCGLGLTYTQTGFYTVALKHYEDAQRLCGDDPAHEDLPTIYYGLCDVLRLMGDFDQAFQYGRKALELYQKRSERLLEGRIRNLLGRICFQTRDFHDAADYYTEAITIASSLNSPRLLIANFTAMADLRLAEGRLEEARRYCDYAQEASDRLQDGQIAGMMYLVRGKVAESEAEQVQGQRRQQLLDEAIAWYEKAKTVFTETQAATHLAEVYRRLAQLLENVGRQQQAIEYWKNAYTVFSNPKGPDWQ